MNQVRKALYYFVTGTLLFFLAFLLITFAGGLLTDRYIKVDRAIAVFTFLFLLCSLGCVITYIWNSKTILESKKTFYVILCFIILLQIVVVLVLKTQPVKDLLFLHDQAVHLLTHKKVSLTYHWDYFARYPNNNAYLLVLTYVYKFCVWIGVPVSKLILVGNVLNIFFIDGAVGLGYLIIKNIESKKIARFYLVLCVLNPEIYLWVPFYYTHTCSLFITVLSIYLCLKIYKYRCQKSFIWYFGILLMGVIVYLGYKIRATNFITFIAFLMLCFVFSSMKQTINKHILLNAGKILTLFCAGICITMLVYSNIQTKHIDSDKDKELPVTHWIMMGSHGKGMFDMNDLEYTNSFPTKKEKERANVTRTIENYKELGFWGTLDLYGRKLRTTWAVGHDDYPNRLSVSSDYVKAHDWIIGKQSTLLIIYCYVFRFMMLLLICILSLYMFRSRDKHYFFISLILLGGMVFHCLWEANSKYSLCFMVINLILMTKGFTVLSAKIKIKNLNRKQNLWILLVSGIFALICTVVVINSSESFYSIAADQQESTGPIYVGKKYGDRIVQSFVTKNNFNMLRFATYDVCSENILGIKLLNEKKQVLDYQILKKKELPEHQNIIIEFKKTIKNNSKNKYYIEFINLDHEKANVGISYYHSGNIDIYQNGECYLNGQELNKGDLRFKVFEAKSGTL